MKVKFKLNKQVLQDFFLRHVEKLVLILIVGLFLAMGYYAIARPVYNQAPQDLTSLATQTREQVEKTPGEIGKKPVVNYPEKAQLGQKAIEVEGYAWKTYWDPRLFPKQGKRGEPTLLVVQKLRGSADCGAFTVSAGAEQGAQSGRRWIVVTGVVPYSEQIEAFNEVLKFMRRPEGDTPKYYTYEIERAEIFGDARDATPVWTPIDLRVAYGGNRAWGGMATDVIAPEFSDPRLTFPLGPLTGRAWGEEVAHPPEIPLRATIEGKPEATDRSGGSGNPVPPTALAPPGLPTPGGETAAPASADAAPVKRKYLFRFFDYSVAAGHLYRYRVRLVLMNPNFGVESRFLVNPESTKAQYLWTPWSEPTGIVAVARDDKVLLVSVKPPLRNYGDPEATLMIVKWLADRGIYVHEKFPGDKSSVKIYRGQWLNMAGALTELAAPEANPLDDTRSKGRPKAGQPAGTTITYQTDALLLDMRGGERFSLKDKGVAPAEMLLWDHDQTLVVRTDVDDSAAVDAAAKTAAVNTNLGEGMPGEVAGGSTPAKPAPGAKAAAKTDHPAGALFGLDADKKKGGAKKTETKPRKNPK